MNVNNEDAKCKSDCETAECRNCPKVSEALCEGERDKYCVNCGNIRNKIFKL